MGFGRVNQLSDEELARRCKTELPFITVSFEELINRHKDEVFRKAYHMLRVREDAEDLTQDIFLKVFDSLPKFEMRASFRTWISAITKNTCLTYIDSRKRKAWWWMTEDIDEVKESEKEDKSLFLLVTEGLEREDVRAKIDAVLGEMSVQSREVLLLRYYDELDYQSIADQLNINLSAAKMRLKRAREDFSQLFNKLQDE